MNDDLKAAQAESDRARRDVGNLALEFHNADTDKIAGITAEYRTHVPDLPATEQTRWWNELVVVAGEVSRLELERDHDTNHLARIAARNALPAAELKLEQTAYFAVFANATVAFLKAQGAA